MSNNFRIIHWTGEWLGSENSDAEVWVDVARVDAAWLQAEPIYHVGPGAPTDEHYRYERFGQFLATTKKPIERSVIHPSGNGARPSVSLRGTNGSSGNTSQSRRNDWYQNSAS